MIFIVIALVLFLWISMQRMCANSPLVKSTGAISSRIGNEMDRSHDFDDINRVFEATVDGASSVFGEHPIVISLDKWHVLHHVIPLVLARMKRHTQRLEFAVTHLDAYRAYEDERGAKEYRVSFIVYEKSKNMSVKVYTRVIEDGDVMVIAELRHWNDDVLTRSRL